MTGTALITGNSSGIGLGLTEELLERGYSVYGISRRGCPLDHPALSDQRCDLSDLEAIPSAMSALLSGVARLDLVVLNAGILGPMQTMRETSIEQLEQIQRVNVWSNKCLMDWFIDQPMSLGQVLLISSGAAVNGNLGWGGYAMSKAALNMLTQLYAHELPDSQLIALAPGLVDTAMQDFLCGEVDSERFPSVQNLKNARGTEAMPGPRQAAKTMIDLLPRLKAELPSGAFADVRSF